MSRGRGEASHPPAPTPHSQLTVPGFSLVLAQPGTCWVGSCATELCPCPVPVLTCSSGFCTVQLPVGMWLSSGQRGGSRIPIATLRGGSVSFLSLPSGRDKGMMAARSQRPLVEDSRAPRYEEVMEHLLLPPNQAGISARWPSDGLGSCFSSRAHVVVPHAPPMGPFSLQGDGAVGRGLHSGPQESLGWWGTLPSLGKRGASWQALPALGTGGSPSHGAACRSHLVYLFGLLQSHTANPRTPPGSQ